MGESHTEGKEKGEFCSLRREECPCGNKYQDIMKGTEKWGKYPQRHRTAEFGAVERSPEAHHVLPVASVTGEITANSKIKQQVVENTKWCVNSKENMIALPLFEMTFLHYIIHEKTTRPPFAGLPMHNYDHGAFQKEVGVDLNKIGTNAEQNTKAHEKATKELLAAINKCRDFYKPELKKRGKRGKGTHKEFLNAMEVEEDDDSAEEWFIPFSMAKDPAEKPFPVAGKKGGLSRKLDELRKAFEKFSERT